ncbi:hypothetical protein CCP1ISM_110020 [Azospirillaceae bacterium]
MFPYELSFVLSELAAEMDEPAA